MRRLKLLDLWVFRGFFYAYTGLKPLVRSPPLTLQGDFSPRRHVGLALLAAGITYIAMGGCCIKSVAESKRSARYQKIAETGDGERLR